MAELFEYKNIFTESGNIIPSLPSKLRNRVSKDPQLYCLNQLLRC